MKLTADQIAQNWDDLLTVIKTEFTGTRKDKLLAIKYFFQIIVPLFIKLLYDEYKLSLTMLLALSL